MPLIVSNNKMRNYKRTEIEIKVRYQPIKNSHWYTTVTKGLGTGGVCLMSKEYLGQGSILRVQLPFPGPEDFITATGLVIWSDFLNDRKAYESGIRFFRLNDTEKKTITSFIDEFVRLRSGSPLPAPDR